ncbi:hypothetical protein D3C72_1626440 [compost metagenome]
MQTWYLKVSVPVKFAFGVYTALPEPSIDTVPLVGCVVMVGVFKLTYPGWFVESLARRSTVTGAVGVVVPVSSTAVTVAAGRPKKNSSPPLLLFAVLTSRTEHTLLSRIVIPNNSLGELALRLALVAAQLAPGVTIGVVAEGLDTRSRSKPLASIA